MFAIRKTLTVTALAAAGLAAATLAMADVYPKNEQQKAEKHDLAGGKGTVSASYAFTRDKAPADWAIKEISWLTLPPGASIGYHKHENNEDAYIVVSGQGLFKDADGNEVPVSKGDVTIVRKGQSHGLSNPHKEPLVVLDVVAQQ